MRTSREKAKRKKGERRKRKGRTKKEEIIKIIMTNLFGF
jgi:hypothetical protein